MAIKNVKGMTKKEMFLALLEMGEVKANAEIVEKINHEIELLDNKSAKGKAVSAEKAKENAVLAEAIVKALSTVEKARVSDIAKMDGIDANASKITYILGTLKDNGQVVRTQDGKKVFYSLAE